MLQPSLFAEGAGPDITDLSLIQKSIQNEQRDVLRPPTAFLGGAYTRGASFSTETRSDSLPALLEKISPAGLF